MIVLETKAFYAETIHERHKTLARPRGLRGTDNKHFGNEEEEGGHDNDYKVPNMTKAVAAEACWSSLYAAEPC